MENPKIKTLPGLKENVSLKPYTTFKIGGRARYFFIAKTIKDIIRAIEMAKELNLPFFVIGGGSNVLISDKKYNGLVIKIKNSRCQIKSCNSGFLVFTGAGLPLKNLVKNLLDAHLEGLEWAWGIPGTIGGAIYGNAGAFGHSIGDFVKEVFVLDTKDLKIKRFSKKECQLSYKKSIFKEKKNLIIVEAVLELKSKTKKPNKEGIKKILETRAEKHPLDFPSAGSIFKNPRLRIRNSELIDKFPKLKEFNKKGEIPAGFLIEKAGLKGKRIGDAKISEKHANFIINLGKAKAKDVLELIGLIKKKVKEKFQIELEEEIQHLGDFPY
jgi:UDP-N-acetylmuramate dehydrogenase